MTRREKLLLLIGMILGMLLTTLIHHIVTSPHPW